MGCLLGGEGFFGEGFHECEREGSLLGFVEFGTVVGEVEDVDGDFAFGIDEGYFDVAIFVGEAEGDLAEQSWGVLGGDLEQGAVAGGFVVKGNACFDIYFGLVALELMAARGH